MRSLRITLCAGAVVAAALAPAAYAADAGVWVTPASPAPGSDIQLRATGCAGQTGTAKSAAFVADAQLTGKDGALVGDSRVPTSLKSGTYDIKVSCDGYDDKVKGTVTVAAGGGPSPSAPASPVAPVHAGGGGTAHLALVDARETGPGTRQAVIGLVLASVAAVAVAVRSARRSRHGEARD
ncbi:hypothetical protein OG266_27905 [Streptomyces sp. NBC_00554]|uniref:hypothetical protein n=1 Tax=Streptomyces sp. NBC_00554 TaxID=2903661 RepID=UPI00352F5DB4|nr:hypothetical protein OG266_27905 [Streptomyces sp. NBC_00554]